MRSLLAVLILPGTVTVAIPAALAGEEPGLQKRFGTGYDRYAAAVPRWVPRWRAWEPDR